MVAELSVIYGIFANAGMTPQLPTGRAIEVPGLVTPSGLHLTGAPVKPLGS